MDSKCFVPECNRSVGVLFPKNAEVRNKWLRELGLEDYKPDSKSFICLKHFGADGQPCRNWKETKSKGISNNDTSQEVIDPKKLETLKKLSKSNSKSRRGNRYQENAGSESDEVSETSHQGRGRKCRLCLTTSTNVKNHVFDKITTSVTIAQAVTICLVPLQISSNDKLSKYVCFDCTNLLKSYYKFHVKCFENDRKQRLETRKMQHKSENDADSEYSDEYWHEEGLSDFEEMSNKYCKKDYSYNKSGQKDQTNEDLIKVLEGNDEVVLTKVKKPPPSIDEASNDDEESQYESLNEGDETEDIIIEMVDDNDQSPESSPPPIDLPENITIRRVQNGVKKPEKRKICDKSDNENGRKQRRILPKAEPGTVFPGEKNWQNQSVNTYISPLGTYQASQIKYVANSTFILAGNYLYKLGLRLNQERRLSCAKLKCPAQAIQKQLAPKEYAQKITVKVGHNHPEPDEDERKIQMFYHLLYLDMKRQKHFNFKTHYDEMCKLDPSIMKLLPIRDVVKEICRQGPVHITEKIHTFNDLFAHIESENCSKLQFNLESIQFYQAKFATGDGAKGLLFGNEETIEKYSSAKVMYVDSTFVIKTQDFPINLVTVLALNNQAFHPVCFAVVNKHSQELYRKIFGFVYHTLAPKLRPEEIVTEFEANLYYALGETYNSDSVIGGSIFSYAQNIYKQLCSLNLSRKLELNARFRHIFDMLVILPLMPVNSVKDALSYIQNEANKLQFPEKQIDDLFTHVKQEWIEKVSIELFSIHRLEHRISENVVPTFKKLRDFLVQTINVTKNKSITIDLVISKLMELDKHYSVPVSGHNVEYRTCNAQRKLILRVWDFLDSNPEINVDQLFKHLSSFVKNLENQLWIWGLYRFDGQCNEMLIDRRNFIMDTDANEPVENEQIIKEANPKTDIKVEDSQEGIEGGQETADTVEEYYLDDGGEIRKISADKSNSQLLTEFTEEMEYDIEDSLKVEDLEEGADVVELFEDSNGECYIIENGEKKMVSQVEGDDAISFMYQ